MAMRPADGMQSGGKIDLGETEGKIKEGSESGV
jgi:hypothetical protein